jgi:hypothetical protein
VNDGTKHQATIISSVISIDCMGVKQCHVYHPGKSSPFFVGWYKLTIPRKMGGKFLALFYPHFLFPETFVGTSPLAPRYGIG